MPKYRNYISKKYEDIDTAVAFYLFAADGGCFKFSASPNSPNCMELEPFTRVGVYWPILREQLTPANQAILFNDTVEKNGRKIEDVIRSKALTKQEIQTAFNFNPTKMECHRFNTAKQSVDIFRSLIALFSSTNESMNHYAYNTLYNLSSNQANRHIIMQVLSDHSNAVHLVNLLTSPAMHANRYVAMALAKLALNDNSKIAIQNVGGIGSLTSLLTSPDMETKRYAEMALINVTSHDENQIAIRDADDNTSWIGLLKSPDRGAKDYALAILGRFEYNAENHLAIRHGGEGDIALLTALLTSPDMETKRYVAMALCDLARSNDENQIAIREAGGITPLIDLLKSPDTETKCYAAMAIASLARNAENKIAIRDAGGITPLIDLLMSPDKRTRRHATKAFVYLTRNAENQIAIRNAHDMDPLAPLLVLPAATLEPSQTPVMEVNKLLSESRSSFFSLAPDFAKPNSDVGSYIAVNESTLCDADDSEQDNERDGSMTM